MNTSVKVSVIVPIYNVEKYLRQCLDSVINQTLREIEIILVDDGSPDGCPAICDEYAERDSRIQVIHQTNGGTGKAWNSGLAVVKGEYVGLVESDDFIALNMFERLYAAATHTQSDLVKAFFYVFDGQQPIEQCQPAGGRAHFQAFCNVAPEGQSFTPEEIADLLIVLRHPSIWSALYRRELIQTIHFSESKSASYQDVSFYCEAFVKSKRISLVHDCLYYYRFGGAHASSAMYDGERLLIYLDQWELGKNAFKQAGASRKLTEAFWAHSFPNALGFLIRIAPRLKSEYFQRMYTILSDLRDDHAFQGIYLSRFQRLLLAAILKSNGKWSCWWALIFACYRKQLAAKQLSMFIKRLSK